MFCWSTLQDLGCRIYTFITTLRYVLEAAAKHGKTVWVLDRQPRWSPVEGLRREGWQSFVGARSAYAPRPHHGRAGFVVIKALNLTVDYKVIEMSDWQPEADPGYGWPIGERCWINPFAQCRQSLHGALPTGLCGRCDAGRHHALGEEPRHHASARAVRRADINATALLAEMTSLAPHWMEGCTLRPCFFEPTFHKHVGKLCSGLQIHVEAQSYNHAAFRPWRCRRWPSKPSAAAGLSAVARFCL